MDVPDVELYLEGSFVDAMAEASLRREQGIATEADLELLDYVSRPRPEGVSVAQSQSAALDGWERGSRRP
jgi:hypothetical protein